MKYVPVIALGMGLSLSPISSYAKHKHKEIKSNIVLDQGYVTSRQEAAKVLGVSLPLVYQFPGGYFSNNSRSYQVKVLAGVGDEYELVIKDNICGLRRVGDANQSTQFTQEELEQRIKEFDAKIASLADRLDTNKDKVFTGSEIEKYQWELCVELRDSKLQTPNSNVQ